jgi:hypothetical protein
MPTVTVRSRPNDPQALGVAQLRHRQRRWRVDLEHRQVGLRVATDQRGRELPGVGQAHGDVLSVLDDVIVRQDVSGPIHDHAGAARA